MANAVMHTTGQAFMMAFQAAWPARVRSRWKPSPAQRSANRDVAALNWMKNRGGVHHYRKVRRIVAAGAFAL